MRQAKRTAEKAEAKISPESLWEAARPNTQKAIASISESKDEVWLRGFRARMIPVGESEIIAAIASATLFLPPI